jgi:plasmid stabilization system protein ParE
MKYTVIWRPSAEADLADLWIEATDRAAVTQAAAEINRMLTADPLNAGESRSGSDRIVFIPPLMALVEVRELDRLVVVMHVRQLPIH